MYEEQRGDCEYAYLIFKLGLYQGRTTVRTKNVFRSKTIHADRANSDVPKAFKHLSTNIKTCQLSQNIFHSVAGQTSVYLLAIMNCFKHRGETAKC